jgi:hypothetical protein
MKLHHHPFQYDRLELTWMDLIRLMLGREIKVSALIVKRGRFTQ